MGNCVHGIDERWCAYCNGSKKEQEERIAKVKLEKAALTELNKRRKELQSESIKYATRHKEPLNDDELEKVLIYTEGEPKDNIDLLFNLALETNRRLGAIEWIWNIAWDDNFLDYDKGENTELYNKVYNIKSMLGV